MTFFEKASNPQQYDLGQVNWSQEGDRQHFTRKMIFEALLPELGEVAGKRVLDVGSGLGWLTHELTMLGADVTGIDPSEKNHSAAVNSYPELDFRNTSLEEFETTEGFEIIAAVMVFEHLQNLRKTFDKIKPLLSRNGRLITVTGDFDTFTNSREGVSVEVQELAPGKVATRTDYGDRAGVIYDIFRTPERFVREANHSGLNVISHKPFPIPEWLKAEVPRYKDFGDKPIFQIFGFEITR
jgi:SAM-dependent methyltransferase